MRTVVWVAFLMTAVAGIAAADPAPVRRTGATDLGGYTEDVREDAVKRTGVVWPGPRFTDPGNGTVVDTLTGLIWLKSPWTTTSGWLAAQTRAASLASGQQGLGDGSVAGQWRVPNVNEMQSLVDFSVTSGVLPAGHSLVLGLPVGVALWTSTSVAPGGQAAWALWPSNGGVLQGCDKGSAIASFAVRGSSTGPAPCARTGAGDLATYTEVAGEDGLVQAGVAWPSPRFTDMANGTVKDLLTGLIWLKNPSLITTTPGYPDGPPITLPPWTTHTWTQALGVAANLASGQYGLTDGSAAGDWRLPSIEELRSIIDYQQYAQAVPNTLGTGPWSAGNPFTNLYTGAPYWSSTTLAPDTTKAWQVLLLSGATIHAPKTDGAGIWPVR